MSSNGKTLSNGICERRVLNVDRQRQRCQIPELDQSKLRRVAFCVDVEIASNPRYTDEDVVEERSKEKKERKRMAEKSEGDALKRPQEAIVEKDKDSSVRTGTEEPRTETNKEAIETAIEVKSDLQSGDKDANKKKEKKKRSEEERKARKEKKRRLAEDNGTLPVELVRESSDNSLHSTLEKDSAGSGSPKTHASPTTDPLRIYRRCCQLRETPILRKITEQLGPSSSTHGVVNKLDLTGYWLQLPDLVTLGDYLAVVPIRELIMGNCGLTDEGVRVILAGLLAAKTPRRSREKIGKDGNTTQSGFIEHLVLQNNVMIGRDGWRYICLFLNMSRSLKSIDLSRVPFPQAPPSSPQQQAASSPHPTGTSSSTASSVGLNADISCLFDKAIGERLAGPQFELLNISQCGITTDQLGALIDGVVKSGLCRLSLAGNNITPEGMEHVVRFLKDGKCQGLDLSGNDLQDQLGVIASALGENSNLYALSLADCNLTPDSLWSLFPALSKLKNMRFIDLSQNHQLFDQEPSALPLLRR